MIKTKPATNEYESGWDAIWGKDKDAKRGTGRNSESNQRHTDVKVCEKTSCKHHQSGCTTCK